MAVLTEIGEKNELLEREGYIYSFDSHMYIHKRKKKAFSMECVEDRSLLELLPWIAEPPDPAGKWQLYFSDENPPSDLLREDIATALGG